MASMAVSNVEYPVIRMTGTPTARFCSASRNSIPDMPGILLSSRTTSNGLSASKSGAPAASPRTATWWPAASEVVVGEPTLLVVEPDPELLVVSQHLDLQRLARRAARDRGTGVRLDEEGVGVGRLGREGERRPARPTGPLGAAKVLARLLA